MRKAKKAFIVAFEGMPGAGKSTCVKLLASSLKRMGFRVGVSDGEKTGDSQILRAIAKRYSFNDPKRIALFQAIRFDQSEIIDSLSKTADVILVDRYVGTETIYGRYAHKLPEEMISWTISQLSNKPRMTFYLASPIKVLSRRKHSKTYDRPDMARRMNSGYQKIAKKQKWVTIDAQKSIQEVYNSCLRKLLRELQRNS